MKPDAARLVCKAQPEPPAGNTDREVAGFMVNLIDAGADCRGKLQWLRDYFGSL